MQNVWTDLMSLLASNLGAILTAIVSIVSSFVLYYFRRHSNAQLEAIQASLLPSFDVEISRKIKKHRRYRVLLLCVTIKNVGKVIAGLLDLEIALWRHDPLTYWVKWVQF